MKPLVDECLSVRVAEALVAGGHDAVHVGDRSLLGSPDTQVPAVAAAEDRVLISADTDFGELLARTRATWPSVILLRQASRLPSVQSE